MENCPARLFFPREIKFLRKCDFPWKIYTFQSNPSKTNPKDFLMSLKRLFLLSEKREFSPWKTLSVFSSLLDSPYFLIVVPLLRLLGVRLLCSVFIWMISQDKVSSLNIEKFYLVCKISVLFHKLSFNSNYCFKNFAILHW